MLASMSGVVGEDTNELSGVRDAGWEESERTGSKLRRSKLGGVAASGGCLESPEFRRRFISWRRVFTRACFCARESLRVDNSARRVCCDWESEAFELRSSFSCNSSVEDKCSSSET